MIHSIKAFIAQVKGAFLGIWLIGGVLTVLLYFATDHYYQHKLAQRTEVLIDQSVNLVKQRFEKYEYGLLSTRGAMLLSGDSAISRQRFNRYIASLNLVKEFPGARGFGLFAKYLLHKSGISYLERVLMVRRNLQFEP